jgi:hypothetical protein
LVAGIFSPVSGEISSSSGAGGRAVFTAKTKEIRKMKISHFYCFFAVFTNTLIYV